MSSIITVSNVRGRYNNESGFAEINLEDAARGLGFVETAASGNECIRWRTVRKYLSEFGIATSCDNIGSEGLPEFIPENIFYKLCFKASNETARKFQDLVTDEILPTIRKTGAYTAPQKAVGTEYGPLQIAEMIAQHAKTKKRLDEANDMIDDLVEKADFADAMRNYKKTMPIGEFVEVLKDNGFDITEKGMIYKLQDYGYLNDLSPTRHALNSDFFVSRPVYTSVGFLGEHKLELTGAGQQYFTSMFMKSRRERIRSDFYGF